MTRKNGLLNHCKRKCNTKTQITTTTSRLPNIFNKHFKCWQQLRKQIITGRAPLYRVPKKVQIARTFVLLQTCNST